MAAEGSAIASLFLALGLGGAVSLLAARLKVPPLLPLLVVGIVMGGSGLGWVDANSLGAGLGGLVGLVISVLIYEGSLLLDRDTLRQAPRVVRGLLTTGAFVGWASTFLAAHYVLGLPIGPAAVLAAILIVTGPTVIQPLLRRVRLTPKLHSALLSEGILIDPIGVVATVVMINVVLAARASGEFTPLWQPLLLFARPFAAGIAVGVVMGTLIAVLSARQWWHGREGEQSVIALCTGLGFVAFGVAEVLAPEGGLVAAAVVGLILANRLGRHLVHVRRAMDRLAGPLVGTLFVLLASRFDVERLAEASWREAAFVAAVLLVSRPLTALMATYGTDMNWRERVYLALTGPRGVVAVSAAALAAGALTTAAATDAQREDIARIETAVLGVVVVSVTWVSLGAGLLARLLRVSGPDRNGVLIVGSHALGREVARQVTQMGLEVRLVDSSEVRVGSAHAAGLPAHAGDATDPLWLESQAEAARAGYVLAMTGNLDVDTVAARWAEHHLGPGRGARWPAMETAEAVLTATGGGTPSTPGELTRQALGRLESLLDQQRFVVMTTESVLPGDHVVLSRRRDRIVLAAAPGVGWQYVVARPAPVGLPA